MSYISAGNTTTTTIKINGDTTGNLIFATGGANTAALKLDNAQNAQLTAANTKILNSSGNPILQQTGSVLQVVSANITGGGSTTSTSFANTNLTASITPTYSGSKILVLFNQYIGIKTSTNARIDYNLRLTGAATSDLLGYYYYGTDSPAGVGYIQTVVSGSYLYTTASTSACTFTTQVRKAGGGSTECDTIYYSSYAATSGNTMTLIEIAA